MTIKLDITQITEGIIIHSVHCQGKSLGGLAGAISKKWPIVLEKYLELTSKTRDFLLLGTAQVVPINDKLTVINLFGQLDHNYEEGGRKTDYCAISNGLKSALEQVPEMHLTCAKVFIPKLLGANLGRGKSSIILPIVRYWIPDVILCEFP